MIILVEAVVNGSTGDLLQIIVLEPVDVPSNLAVVSPNSGEHHGVLEVLVSFSGEGSKTIFSNKSISSTGRSADKQI